MSGEQRLSLRNQGPFDGRPGKQSTAVDDDFGVLVFSGGVLGAETTHIATALPAHWAGREVGAICSGGVAYVGFSLRADAIIDRGAAASDAGTAAQSGLPLPNSMSVETRIRLPMWQPHQTVYFVRESDAVGTIVRLRVL